MFFRGVHTVLIVLAFSLMFSGEAFAQKSPLIMKHADSLAVARKRGTLLLHGRVHFVHDSINVRTQRATWNKDGDVISCEGGFLFTHPSGWIDAHTGIYQKKKGLASASGDVHAGDSAHTYYATGEYVEYDRENEILNMPDKPRLYYYDKKDSIAKKDAGTNGKKVGKKSGKSSVKSAAKNDTSTVDTVTVIARHIIYNKRESFAEGHGDASITHKEVSIKADDMTYDRKEDYAQGIGHVIITHDDVTVSADRMNYSKKNDFAEAFGNVKVTQDEMVVTCDTGYFDRKNNWMSMKGHPACELKNYKLTGDSIFLVLDSTGQNLKSALVIRNAHGLQREESKKNVPGSVTEAFGDTLYAQFDGNKIERLYVNLNARGFFYETDLEAFRNNMNGERLDLFFKQGKMDHALVSGKANSIYYYVKNDRTVAGLNEAAGDTIYITFDPKKNAVKKLRMLGGSSTPSSGRYVDLEKENRKKELTKSEKKSDIKKVAESSDTAEKSTTANKTLDTPAAKKNGGMDSMMNRLKKRKERLEKK